MSLNPPAGLLRRLAALIYDLLLVIALMMLTTIALIAVNGGEPIRPGNPLYQAALVLTIASFFVGFWVYGGQTLGMRAWRISVETSSGQALDLKTGCLRFAAGVLSALPLGLGFIWMLVDRQRLTWYDRVADTRVGINPKIKKK
jgi:uncharacterized RDD family membrane protein YckC